MIKTAIYSRFSTNRQNESSISDQVRICTEYADGEGMVIIAQYKDEGISGAAFGNRPAFNEMRAAAMAREFDVLLVTDTTRLSRSQELAPLIDLLRFQQVQIIGVQDNFDSSVGSADMQAGLSGIMSVEFRKIVKARTHAALESRAKAHRSAGGKCFGYSSEPVDPSNPKSQRVHVVEESQAAIVREIFERYAEGMTQRSIAKLLNERGVPSPGSSWKRETRRCNGWMASGIRVIVNNVRYTGLIRWNVSEWIKNPDTGKRLRRERPREEWLEHHDESLRVVPDELFEKAQRRSQSIANPDARLKRGGKVKYLLSGLLKCNECGANYILTSKASYQCSGSVGGACGNKVRVRRDLVEEKILDPVRKELLAPERVDAMAKEIDKYVREHYRMMVEKSTPANIQKINARIRRLRERLAAGDPDLEADELQLAIGAAENKRRNILEAQPASKRSAKILTAVPKAAQVYRRQIELGLGGDAREAAKARVILRDLLGPIQMCPGPDGSLWAQYHTRPAALVKRAVGASVELSGSGGAIVELYADRD